MTRINKPYSEITHDDIVNFMYEHKISVVPAPCGKHWRAYVSYPELFYYEAPSIKQAVYDCYVSKLVV